MGRPAKIAAALGAAASIIAGGVFGLGSSCGCTVTAPESSSPPAISGTTTQGQVLTASNGSWRNSPTSYTYQWEDCNASGLACSYISGATGSTYTLQAGDVGFTLRVVTTASNASGAASSSSAASTAVTGGGNTFSCPSGVRCFYIANSGSDSNSGTSEATPWAHAPGMPAFSGTYAAQTSDEFVFKGGDTWSGTSNASTTDFPLAVPASGNATHDVYYGVDSSWYSGATWTQPKFDAANILTAGADANGPSCPSLCGAGANDVMVDLYRRDYVEIDNIHFTNFRRDSTMTSVAGVCAMINSSNQGNPSYDQNITYNHLLMDHMYDDAADVGCDAIIGGNSEAGHYAGNSIVENSTIVGDGATYMKGIGLVGNIENNTIHDLPGLIGPVSTGTATVSGNLLYDCGYPALPSDGGASNNQHFDALIIGGVTTSSTPAATYYIHDNVIYNTGQSGFSTGTGTGDECESLMIGNWNETDYVWNNVLFDLYGNGPVSPQSGAPTITGAYYWNNSIEPGTDAAGGEQCFRFEGGSTTYTQLTIQNNLCVTTSGANANDCTASSGVCNLTGPTITNSTLSGNLVATPTQIKAGGTYAGDFGLPPSLGGSSSLVWKPLGSAPTDNAGTNLTSTCSGSLTGLCSDTTYAGTRTSAGRPSVGTWDTGAYQVP